VRRVWRRVQVWDRELRGEKGRFSPIRRRSSAARVRSGILGSAPRLLKMGLGDWGPKM